MIMERWNLAVRFTWLIVTPLAVMLAALGCTLNDPPYRVTPDGEREYLYSANPLHRLGIPQERKPGYLSYNSWYESYVYTRIRQEFARMWASDEYQKSIRKIQPNESIFIQFIIMPSRGVADFWVLRKKTNAGHEFKQLVAKLMTDIEIHSFIPAEWVDENEYYLFNYIFSHPDAKKSSSE